MGLGPGGEESKAGLNPPPRGQPPHSGRWGSPRPHRQPHAAARRQPRCRQHCADRGGLSLCSTGFVVSTNSQRGRGPPKPAGCGVLGPAGR